MHRLERVALHHIQLTHHAVSHGHPETPRGSRGISRVCDSRSPKERLMDLESLVHSLFRLRLTSRCSKPLAACARRSTWRYLPALLRIVARVGFQSYDGWLCRTQESPHNRLVFFRLCVFFQVSRVKVPGPGFEACPAARVPKFPDLNPSLLQRHLFATRIPFRICAEDAPQRPSAPPSTRALLDPADSRSRTHFVELRL